MTKILVACEESQAVTQEFRRLGAEAYSCDIIETSGSNPEWHFKQDVIPLLNEKWDAIIAFPPCTDLAVSGAAWFEQKRKDGRQQKSIDFFMLFADLDCEFVAIENPVGIMSSIWRKPDQIIQPYEFGHPTTKKTCLWLKNLPKLEPTRIVEPVHYIHKSGKKAGLKDPLWHYETLRLPAGERAKQRSKTFEGIARAMAEQWLPAINRGI